MKNIIDNLIETYGGMPWHGHALRELLKGVTAEMAFHRPLNNAHTIAELVAHILVWRQYVVEILNENYDFSVDIGSMSDFPVFNESDKVWQELLTQLSENQEDILQQLNGFDASKLDDDVPKKPFTFRFLFEGIVYHDVYHGGQIGMLKAAYLAQASLDKTIVKKLSFI
jgi:hypothetical protein